MSDRDVPDADLIEFHLELDDVAGCAEIWEQLSEDREDPGESAYCSWKAEEIRNQSHICELCGGAFDTISELADHTCASQPADDALGPTLAASSPILSRSASRAQGNVERWGLQPLTTILLAAVEELGEIAEEIVPPRISEDVGTAGTTEAWHQLHDLVTLGVNVQVNHETHWEDEYGHPLDEDERPAPVPLLDDLDVEAVRAEIVDSIALLVQADRALRELEEGR